MTINRNNFEEYYLDYLEGNLDPLLIADLMAFMAENPEFEKFLPEIDNNLLNTEEKLFENKHLMKKTFSDIKEITEKNFEEFCIASVEGILNNTEKLMLLEYISGNTEKEEILKKYESLKLKPDFSITFKEKAVLKKNKKGTLNYRVIYYGLSLAASIALILALFNINKPDILEKLPNIKPLAVKTDTIIKSENPKDIKTTNNKPVLKSLLIPADKDDIEKDTNYNSQIKEEIKLAKLEPVNIVIINSNGDKFPLIYESQNKDSLTERQNNKFPNDREGILTLIAKVDFWKTAEKAISGINMLTESDMSISKTTDKEGNLTGLLLSTESYIVEGNKVK